jgi:hypothetical protein
VLIWLFSGMLINLDNGVELFEFLSFQLIEMPCKLYLHPFTDLLVGAFERVDLLDYKGLILLQEIQLKTI